MIDRIKNAIQHEMAGAGLPFVGFCIALNLTVGQIAALLKFPLYLDSIGTVLVAILCGPWSAFIAGTSANILAGAFGNPTMMFFIPVVAVIAIFTAFIARQGWFRSWYRVIPAGVFQGVLAALASAPISAYLFSGITLGGQDFLVLYFRSMGNTILESVFYQGLSSDPADKTITYVTVFLLLRNLPVRLLSRFHGAGNIRRIEPHRNDGHAN
jgi:energy-coupling factor transport system substrate-specific component